MSKKICFLCPSGLCIVAVHAGRLLFVEVGCLLVTHRLVKLNVSLRFCFAAVGAKQPLFAFLIYLLQISLPCFKLPGCAVGYIIALLPSLSLCSGSS